MLGQCRSLLLIQFAAVIKRRHADVYGVSVRARVYVRLHFYAHVFAIHLIVLAKCLYLSTRSPIVIQYLIVSHAPLDRQTDTHDCTQHIFNEETGVL